MKLGVVDCQFGSNRFEVLRRSGQAAGVVSVTTGPLEGDHDASKGNFIKVLKMQPLAGESRGEVVWFWERSTAGDHSCKRRGMPEDGPARTGAAGAGGGGGGVPLAVTGVGRGENQALPCPADGKTLT